mmetsp:Transcript_152679/g.292399  ORF Transcript_152679/g.292399 Transcript_152679/m.292399 type:complete len:84 (+) Transcript_152679:83-334(+)
MGNLSFGRTIACCTRRDRQFIVYDLPAPDKLELPPYPQRSWTADGAGLDPHLKTVDHSREESSPPVIRFPPVGNTDGLTVHRL